MRCRSPTSGSSPAWGLKRIVLNLLTGFVPILPFVAEQRVTRSTEALLSRAYLTGDGSRAAGLGWARGR